MTSDPSSTADRFDAAMDAIEAPITHLAKVARQNRVLIFGLAGSLVFDIGLSIVLGVVAVHANNAANLANSVNKAALTACHARNDFKRLDLDRWTTIVTEFAAKPKDQTEAEKALTAKQTAKFVTYISKADAPEQC